MTAGAHHQNRLPRSVRLTLAAFLLLALGGTLRSILQTEESGELESCVYVWNRTWNDSVRKAIRNASSQVSGFTVLSAQIDFKDDSPRVTRVGCDYPTLKQTGKPVGVAVRVGPYSGPYTREGTAIATIIRVASAILSEASAAGLPVNEVQIDYDCPESDLSGYRTWIAVLRKALAPVPVTITALPVWLKHQEFKRLVEGLENYVLQVHSLETPADASDPVCLFDPARTWNWLNKADKVGTPFRLALPTYGYRILFDDKGNFAGLSAEERNLRPVSSYEMREVHSDPVVLSRFVRRLGKGRPENLLGLIWFRLPVRGDRFNWRWPTLAAVMEGRLPVPEISVDLVWKDRHRLLDLFLVNKGNGETSDQPGVSVAWKGSRLIAADPLNNFSLVQEEPNEVKFLPAPTRSERILRPGDRFPIGWLRFEKSAQVKANVFPAE